jgi:hypothetical protein
MVEPLWFARCLAARGLDAVLVSRSKQLLDRVASFADGFQSPCATNPFQDQSQDANRGWEQESLGAKIQSSPKRHVCTIISAVHQDEELFGS